MIKKNKFLLGILVAALGQTAVLGWMVYDRITLLKTGREIVLPVIPVDPRSIFRGDFVRLSYPISTVPHSMLVGEKPRGNVPVYVTLIKDEKGEWIPASVKTFYEPALDKNHIVLKARTRGSRWAAWRAGRQMSLKYGIESYFVEEDTGVELELLVRTKKLSILVAVDDTGQSAIKGLMVDGVLRYKEPIL